jgi:hypothetical protein
MTIRLLFPLRARCVFFSQKHPAWHAAPPSHLFKCVLRIKWTMHEAGLSSSPSAEVKNEWKYISAPSVCLHKMHKDKITILPFTVSY